MSHSSSGTDTRNSTRRPASRPKSGKRPVAPASGLSSTELLAKIDALDWDETIVSEPVKLAAGPSNEQPQPAPATPNWRVAGIVTAAVVLLAVLYAMLSPVSSPERGKEAVEPILIAANASDPPGVTVADSGEARIAEVAAAEARRAAKYEQAAQYAEADAARAAERRQKAREARAERRELERRQQEAARIAAEKAAAEAAERAAKEREAAARPKGPASPQELCADAGNIFSRGFCESRACSQAEWRNHPFCVKRLADQVKAIGHGQ